MPEKLSEYKINLLNECKNAFCVCLCFNCHFGYVDERGKEQCILDDMLSKGEE